MHIDMWAMKTAEDQLARLRTFRSETGASLAAMSRACGLHPNSLNRLGDSSWRPRLDTLAKIESFLDQTEEPGPISELTLSGDGWRVVHDSGGWHVVYDNGREVTAVGPFGRAREAVEAALKSKR